MQPLTKIKGKGAILEYPATYLHIPERFIRTRHMKTKGSILIQRDANKWPGILETSQGKNRKI